MPKSARIGFIAGALVVLATDIAAVHAFARPYGLDVALTLASNAESGTSDRQGDKEQPNSQGEAKKPELTPEQKMQARFPQPAKVGHLIGLPVLDGDDSTIGHVQQVVRTPDGKIQLIVPYGKWFGWARSSWLGWARRPVAVPIEVVAILALQIVSIDMDRGEFDKAPTWAAGRSQPIAPDQAVKIALGRR